MLILAKAKRILRALFPLRLMLPAFNFFVKIKSSFAGIKSTSSHGLIRIIKGDKEIRLSASQQIYFKDTIKNFDFYFEGVQSSLVHGSRVVDYSGPAWHSVKQFELMPVFFNSVAEPVATAMQYIDFSGIGEDSVVLDLGAYSALTSILMDQRIKSGGCVIAVEADKDNYIACQKNAELYEKISKRKIELIKAAIWEHDRGIAFSSEGSMGSSAVDIVGGDRGEEIHVDTITLIGLAERFALAKVDFIKCDIEGAETVALNSPEFFSRFRPRVVIECHDVDGINTEAACTEMMEAFGYKCEPRVQHGYPLPLLFCYPE